MKAEIRKMIETFAKSLDVEVKIEENDRVSMSPDQFVRLAMVTGDEEEEEEEKEEENGNTRKPPRKVKDLDPEIVRQALKDLEGEGSSQDIREEILATHSMRIPSATLRATLATMIEKGEVSAKGEARGKTYAIKQPAKGGKGK